MKHLFTLAVIAAFAVTLVGCSKSEDDSANTGPAPKTTAPGKDASGKDNAGKTAPPKSNTPNSAKANQPAPTGATPTPVSDKDIEVGGKLGNK